MATTPKILIVGGGGFLGLAATRHFHRAGWEIVSVGRLGKRPIDPDLLESKKIRFHGLTLPDPRFDEIVAATRPDALLFAAGTSLVGPSLETPFADFEIAVSTHAYCLDALRRLSPQTHYIYLSSAAVYGNPPTLPVDESAPIAPLSPYGFHKAAAEMIVREYEQLFGIRSCIFRIFSAYGEGLRKQVVHDITRQFLAGTDPVITLKGTGRESRDFIHADDVAHAVELAATQRLSGIYNLASGQETTIADLAQKIAHHFGHSKKIEFSTPASKGDPLHWSADIRKIKQCGLQLSVDLDHGLARYCDWLGQNR